MSSKSTTRPITDDYIASLAGAIESRIRGGDTLEQALKETLKMRAPIEFYDPDSGSSSGWGWLFTMGLLAAAGYGANLAAKEFLGMSLVEMVQGPSSDYDDYGTRTDYTTSRTASSSFTNEQHSVAGATTAGAASTTQRRRFEDFDEDFREHHQRTYGDTGRDYGDYEPGYRHGYQYGSGSEYQDRSYSDLEDDIRTSYEEAHGEGSFKDVQGATRHGFQRGRTSAGRAGVESPSGSERTASGDPGSVSPRSEDDE